MDSSVLRKKKLEDLRIIAKTMGIKSVTTYRKDQLIDLIMENAIEEKDEKEEIPDREDIIEIDIEDIDMDKLPDKVSEEIEQMDNINGAEGILEVHQDGYGFFKM